MMSVKFKLHRGTKCRLPGGSRLEQVTVETILGLLNRSIKMIDTIGKMIKCNVK